MTVRHADFPENQLGASLKSSDQVGLDQFHGYFPENQLGASLKLLVQLVPRRVEPRLPREPTRGLIEVRSL